jgi:hypothetical protein
MAKQFICRNCGTIGASTTNTKGSLILEIALYFCMILPGLIYSIWRHASRTTGCKGCRSNDLVPVDSPMGKKLVADLQPGADTRTPAEKAGHALGKMVGSK